MLASDDQIFLLLGFVGDNPVLHLSCAVAASKTAAIAAQQDAQPDYLPAAATSLAELRASVTLLEAFRAGQGPEALALQALPA